jgi:hypothetical protein
MYLYVRGIDFASVITIYQMDFDLYILLIRSIRKQCDVCYSLSNAILYCLCLCCPISWSKSVGFENVLFWSCLFDVWYQDINRGVIELSLRNSTIQWSDYISHCINFITFILSFFISLKHVNLYSRYDNECHDKPLRSLGELEKYFYYWGLLCRDTFPLKITLSSKYPIRVKHVVDSMCLTP